MKAMGAWHMHRLQFSPNLPRFQDGSPHLTIYMSEFPQRLENLENENGHGKVMEHEKLAKSH